MLIDILSIPVPESSLESNLPENMLINLDSGTGIEGPQNLYPHPLPF